MSCSGVTSILGVCSYSFNIKQTWLTPKMRYTKTSLRYTCGVYSCGKIQHIYELWFQRKWKQKLAKKNHHLFLNGAH